MTGAVVTGALKVEIVTGNGTFGVGCPGSNGTPTLSFRGATNLGNTLHIDLAQGPVGSAAIMNFGLTNGAPFPIDLTVIGAVGCYVYTDPFIGITTATDPNGSATNSSNSAGRFVSRFS